MWIYKRIIIEMYFVLLNFHSFSVWRKLYCLLVIFGSFVDFLILNYICRIVNFIAEYYITYFLVVEFTRTTDKHFQVAA